jgi:hypothetical protein
VSGLAISADARASPSELWAAVDRLLDSTSEADLDDLIGHRMQLLAARRWRTLGRSVPSELVHEERVAALRTLTAPLLLRRVCEAYGSAVLVLKGPEAAARYPDPMLRPFKDLDLLVEDAEEAQSALLAAGFEPVGCVDLYIGIHHERPLWLPGQPLVVEIHSEPKWPDGMPAPTAAELFELAGPSALGVEGTLGLPPGPHALTLAAHSWAHEPLRRVVELLDVAALVDGADRRELEALARHWGLGRLWRTTLGAAHALFAPRSRRSWPLRLWARNLQDVRGRTVFESHLERWLAGYWSQPPGRAVGDMFSAAARELRPAPGEPWDAKLVRTRRAFRNAFARRADHDVEWRREVERLRERSRSPREDAQPLTTARQDGVER